MHFPPNLWQFPGLFCHQGPGCQKRYHVETRERVVKCHVPRGSFGDVTNMGWSFFHRLVEGLITKKRKRCCLEDPFHAVSRWTQRWTTSFSEILASSNGMKFLVQPFQLLNQKNIKATLQTERKLTAGTWKGNSPWNSWDSDIGNYHFEGLFAVCSLGGPSMRNKTGNNPTGPADVAVVASSWNAIPSLLAEAPWEKKTVEGWKDLKPKPKIRVFLNIISKHQLKLLVKIFMYPNILLFLHFWSLI